MTKRTILRPFSSFLLGDSIKTAIAAVVAKMLSAEAKAKQEAKAVYHGIGHTTRTGYEPGIPGYESQHPRAHWKRWYRAKQKRQRQARADRHQQGARRFATSTEPLSKADVA